MNGDVLLAKEACQNHETTYSILCEEYRLLAGKYDKQVLTISKQVGVISNLRRQLQQVTQERDEARREIDRLANQVNDEEEPESSSESTNEEENKGDEDANNLTI